MILRYMLRNYITLGSVKWLRIQSVGISADGRHYGRSAFRPGTGQAERPIFIYTVCVKKVAPKKLFAIFLFVVNLCN